MAQWVKICLPVQGTRVQSLVRKVPPATEQPSVCAMTTGSPATNSSPHAPRLDKARAKQQRPSAAISKQDKSCLEALSIPPEFPVSGGCRPGCTIKSTLLRTLFHSCVSGKYSPFRSSLFWGCLHQIYINQVFPAPEKNICPFKILGFTLKVFIVNSIAFIPQILCRETTLCWQWIETNLSYEHFLPFVENLNIPGKSCQVHSQKFYYLMSEENALPIKKNKVGF